MRCPSCNSRIPDDSMFCPVCGKRLKKKYKRKKRSSNGLVVLIAFLCLLLLIGFILVASRLILRKDTRQPAESGQDTLLTEDSAGEEIVSGETENSEASFALPESEKEVEMTGASLIPMDQETADYDLSGKKIYTVFGTMSSRGTTKELLLEKPKNFYGKDTTGTDLFLREVESVYFASSNSKVSLQELRAIPDGTSLQCEGSMYIHDNKVFLRLENLIWQPASVNDEEVAVG